MENEKILGKGLKRNGKIDICRRNPSGFLTLVNRIIWQKPHNCGFFYVKFIKF